MSLKNAKVTLVVLLMIAVAICAFGLIAFEDESQGMQSCIILAVIFILAAAAVLGKFCRCPHCGKRLFYKLLRLKACPGCGRDFESGKKIAKVRKKK